MALIPTTAVRAGARPSENTHKVSSPPLVTYRFGPFHSSNVHPPPPPLRSRSISLSLDRLDRVHDQINPWPRRFKITTTKEAKKYYPLFGLGANVALIFSGQYVRLVSAFRASLPAHVDKWGVSLKLLMGKRGEGGREREARIAWAEATRHSVDQTDRQTGGRHSDYFSRRLVRY